MPSGGERQALTVGEGRSEAGDGVPVWEPGGGGGVAEDYWMLTQ